MKNNKKNATKFDIIMFLCGDFLPVHEATSARLEKGTSKNADIVLGAVCGMRVISKLIRTVELSGAVGSAGDSSSLCLRLVVCNEKKKTLISHKLYVWHL
jgi:hypothetical protein